MYGAVKYRKLMPFQSLNRIPMNNKRFQLGKWIKPIMFHCLSCKSASCTVFDMYTLLQGCYFSPNWNINTTHFFWHSLYPYIKNLIRFVMKTYCILPSNLYASASVFYVHATEPLKNKTFFAQKNTYNFKNLTSDNRGMI